MKITHISSIAAICAFSLQAHAQTSAVTSSAALPTTDTIGWSQLGAEFSTTTSPANVVSVGGLNATISDGGTLERRNEGSGWGGNFTNGEPLIWNQDNGNAIVIDFADPVFGAGAQIQADDYGNFVATITAFDSSDNWLGSYSFNGNSNSANDGSAIFAGISSSTANISSIEFQIGNGDYFQNDTAIGTLDLNTNSVPDTGATWLLVGLSVVGLVAFRRRFAGVTA